MATERDLRASDADRERTVERLRTAALEGRLDSDELEERLAAAYGSRWCSELSALVADVTPPPAARPPAQPPVFVQPASRTNGFAIASFVLGLVWLLWLGSAAAVVFGHVALRRIARSGGTQTGRGLAIAGLVLGYLGVAGLAAIMFAVLIVA
jgi:hypothetical protein